MKKPTTKEKNVKQMSENFDVNSIPENLTEHSKQIWRNLQDDYNFDVTLWNYLHVALFNLDEAERMTEIIEKEGRTVPTSDGGVKIHPLLSIRDKCYSQFLKAWNLSGLDVEPPMANGRPPAGKR